MINLERFREAIAELPEWDRHRLALDYVAEELEAGRKARDELVAFHDSYDSDRDQYAVTGKLFRILYAWDRAVGRKSPVDPHPSTER